MASKRHNDIEIGWITVTYRSVILTIVGLVVAACVTAYLLFPDSVFAKWVRDTTNTLVNKVATSGNTGSTTISGPQQAHFTNIDRHFFYRRAASLHRLIATERAGLKSYE